MATYSWDPQDAGSFPLALETENFGSRTASSASWHQAWHSCSSGTRIYLQTDLPVWTLCYHPDKLWMHWNVFAELRGCSWSSDLYGSESRRQPVNCIPSPHCPWQPLLSSHSLTQRPPSLSSDLQEKEVFAPCSSVGSLLQSWKRQNLLLTSGAAALRYLLVTSRTRRGRWCIIRLCLMWLLFAVWFGCCEEPAV